MSSAAATYEASSDTIAQLGRPLFGHFIDGEVVPSLDGATMPVIDPGTEEQIAVAALGSEADALAAARSARAAFDDGRWRFLPPHERERRLRRLSALLEERAELFTELDVLDAGLLRMFAGAYVEYVIGVIDYYAGWPTKLHGSVPAVPVEFTAYEVREPLGVVTIIHPWNGPVVMLAFAAAALAAGNSVVLKPAEQTPMTAVLMAELALEAGIPPGVLNVVQGLGEVVGQALVTAPEVDAIEFIGSVATGAAIQAAAAPTIKRVRLELGGKSPLLIFPDANLDEAAAAAAFGVWMASGQVCTCATRTLVHRDVHDEIVSRILEQSRGIPIGHGLDPESHFGPLVSAEQLERVQRYVSIGREEGAELVLGGGRHGDVGYFHEPTIFTSVRNDMRIAQEEIFGPVMSVLTFESEEEAYALANATQYGLFAGVFTNDVTRAHRASRALRAGTININSYMMGYPSVTQGGMKLSGNAKALGAASLDELTTLKSVWTKVG